MKKLLLFLFMSMGLANLPAQAQIPYYSYTTGAAPTGNEVIGPVFQNSHSVTLSSGSLVGLTPFVATGSPTARTNADRASDVINVKDYGATMNGVTDDSLAFQAAFSRAQILLNSFINVKIVIPAGTAILNQSLVLTATAASVNIEGAGRGATYLVEGSGVDALTVNVGLNTGAVIGEFSLVRSNISGYGNAAISVLSNGTQVMGQATFKNLYIGTAITTNARGWGTGIYLRALSNPIIDNVKIWQEYRGTTDDGSSGVKVEGNSTISAVGLKINNSTLQGGWAGLRIGDWTRGVFVNNTDISGNTAAIQWLPDQNTNTSYLSVANSYLKASAYGINMSFGSALVSNTNIVQYDQGISFTGINYTSMANVNVSGSMIQGVLVTGETNLGIHANGMSAWGMLTGNGFNTLNTAIQLDGTSWANVTGNVLTGNTAGFVDNAKNANTVFSDSPTFTTQTISGTGTIGTLINDPAGTPPATSTAACTQGQEAWDGGYEYRCIATNSWQRWARMSDAW